MKNIFIVTIKKTSSTTHYIGYIQTKKGIELIAPCFNGNNDARNYGLHYNSAESSLPPYTLRVSNGSPYLDKSIHDYLRLSLQRMNLCGNFKVFFLSGYNDRTMTINIKKYGV